MFLINSPPHVFRCGPIARAGLIANLGPLICQVPYTLVISITLVFSTTLHVSDLSTSYLSISLVGFLGTKTMRIIHPEGIFSDLIRYKIKADLPTSTIPTNRK